MKAKGALKKQLAELKKRRKTSDWLYRKDKK